MGGLITILIIASLVSPLLIAGWVSTTGRSPGRRILSAFTAAAICLIAPPLMVLITFTLPGNMFEWAAIVAVFNMPFGAIFLAAGIWRWLVHGLKTAMGHATDKT